MKILMLLENDFRNDPRVEKEVHTLHKSGHELVVAAITTANIPFRESRENCLVLRKRITKFYWKASVAALKLPFYFNFWRRYLKSILKIYQFDAVHVHDLPLCRLGMEIRDKYKVKLILDLHENWPALLSISAHTNTLIGRILSSEKQWRIYEKKCTLKADRVIVVVPEMKARIKQLGTSPDKIFVLENTPQLKFVPEIKYNRDNIFFTLIYVGGISYHRGLQFVIEGIRGVVPQLPIRLWIVGDGKYSVALKKQVDHLSLQNYVKFFGILSKAESEDLMRKADVGLIPHIRSEQSDNSSPNKLFEYMAAGLPVMASDCISIKRIIDESDTGLTYIYNSPSDFAAVLAKFYNESRTGSDFSSNGKKAVREIYNWESSSRSLLSLYSNLD